MAMHLPSGTLTGNMALMPHKPVLESKNIEICLLKYAP